MDGPATTTARESERRRIHNLDFGTWDSLVKGSKIATAVLTLDARIAAVNEPFASLVAAANVDELQGAQIADLINGDDPFGDIDAVVSDPLLGRVLPLSLRRFKKAPAEVLLSYRVRTDNQGIPTHIFCQFRTFQPRAAEKPDVEPESRTRPTAKNQPTATAPDRPGKQDDREMGFGGLKARSEPVERGKPAKTTSSPETLGTGAGGMTPVATPRAQTTPMRVLLVNDDEATATATAGLLATASASVVTTCETTRQFIGRAHLEGYDVVVLGLSELDANAVETLLRVRSVVPRIPVVVLSDNHDDDLEHLMVANGAADLIAHSELPRLARVAGDMLLKLLRAASDRHAMLTLQRAHSAGFRRLVELNPDGIVVVNERGIVLMHNGSAARLLARHEDDLVHQRFNHPFTVDDAYELDMRDENGQPRTLEVRSVPAEWLGEPAHLVSLHDITELTRKERSLETTLMHDSLTGLPGRDIFLNRVHDMITSGRPGGENEQVCAVVFIDLDQFRRINDTYGQMVGDRVLQGVANRLTSSVRPGDYVSRVGGDEFAVLFPPQDIDEIVTVAERIDEALSHPFVIDKEEIYCTPTVGLARYTGEGDEYALFGEAEAAAMDNRLDTGVGMIDENSAERREIGRKMSSRLADAVEEGQLFLMYQPIFDLTHGQLVGLEALLRWEHPDDGIITPGEFIQIADESGAMVSLSEWMFAEVADQIVEWRERNADYDIPPVSINVSPRQLVHHDFRRVALLGLARREISPKNIRLEVTEQGLLEQPRRIEVLLRQLDEDGFSIDLDNFGTGLSALAHLQTFPISAVKIDRSFVTRMIESVESRQVVQAGVAVAKAFGITVVGTGVETREHKELLAKWGCDRGQGYQMARPLSALEAARFFERRNDMGSGSHRDSTTGRSAECRRH